MTTEKTIELPKIKLPSGKEITLNQQQADALEQMRAWLDDKHELFFTLAGFAGTGKSSISGELIKYFHKKYPYRRVCVSAPTHKAKKVIARATKEDAFTIQKLLGLRPNTDLENFDINFPQFDERAKKEIDSYKLLILDEASMLNESLFRLIIKEATNSRTKVLFMGDEAQLPPVKESISMIFTEISSKIKLTKVERQADSNPLMLVYDRIRSDIKAPADLFAHETKVNEAGEGIIFHEQQKSFEEMVLPMFASEAYKKDPDHIKLITYTNASVQAWNKRIRDFIYNTPEEPILEGDILLAYNTVVDDEVMVIENSSDYKVQEIKEDQSDSGIDVYAVVLRSVDQNIKTRVQIVRETGILEFLKHFTRLLKYATSASGQQRGYAWRQYYAFKNGHLLLRDIHGEGKLLVKKDIDYGYAITTHKSQGSTFFNVAVSENNLDQNKNHEERNKLKYVAFSRPTNQAIILSNKTK